MHPRSYEEQDQRVTDAIGEIWRESGRCVRILEAGCGNRWPIRLGGIEHHITGVDLDAEALRIRVNIRKDLHAAIQGDLCTVPLPAESFDVVYCAYVLEHIREADVALTNMVRAMRPGGLLVIRIPDPETARGLVTRATPFWFHVFYHRRVMKIANAGKPGYAPYPTHYHPVISAGGLSKYLREHHLVCMARYADSFAKDGHGVAGRVFRGGARAIDLLTLGRNTSAYSDVMYFIRKCIPL